jgi:hypothetical protein
LPEQTDPTDADQQRDKLLARELEAIPFEPLLPIEKALIVGSLVLGVLLLGFLLWASATFFPITGPVTKG